MVTATDAPAVEQPAAESAPGTPIVSGVADAPVAEPKSTSRLQVVGIVVGAVVVAGALFGGGVLVGLNISGSSGTTQNQFGPGNRQFGQNGGGFPGGQNGQQGGTGQQGGGFGQQGGPNGQQNGQQGSSNS